MEGSTIEVELWRRRWVIALLVLSSLVAVTVSLLYSLLPLTPLFYFHGFIRGYYSLLDYKLYYAYNEQEIFMPHSDYIRHVSMVFTILSFSILLVSSISITIAKKKILVSTGLTYGVSSSLIVLHGLLNGYIHRAVLYDMGSLSYSTKDELVYRTLAGVIVFEGTRVEYTWVYKLVFTTPLTPILLAISVLSSAIAISIALYLYLSREPRQAVNKQANKPVSTTKLTTIYTAITLTTLTLLASVFSYYPVIVNITPQPPPATLETPPYNYTCTALVRTTRGALTYTDFETHPVPGWATSGGSWSSVGNVVGAKGNVLQGSDDGGGVGTASHYYYNTDLSANASLWVATKTRLASRTGYYGISMMNTARNRLYEISITTGGNLDIWSYNVVTTGWQRHARVSIPGYTSTAWYIIVVYYTVVGTTITIRAYLYDAGGRYVTEASATINHTSVFRPAYIGVTVDGPTAYFDDFIVSTIDPRSILFTGFYTGMRVEVWDNLGNLVNSTTALASSFYLNITSDIVIGTGVDGRIVARYPDAQLCGVLAVPATDAILGGDTYALTTQSITLSRGANKTSANLTIYISGSALFNTTARILRVNASQVLYARLILENISAPSTLSLDLWIEGVARSSNITVRNGAPVSSSTSIVGLNLGLNNNITLTGYFTSTGQSAILSLKLELCTVPGGMGVCVYYPIALNLSS